MSAGPGSPTEPRLTSTACGTDAEKVYDAVFTDLTDLLPQTTTPTLSSCSAHSPALSETAAPPPDNSPATEIVATQHLRTPDHGARQGGAICVQIPKTGRSAWRTVAVDPMLFNNSLLALLQYTYTYTYSYTY